MNLEQKLRINGKRRRLPSPAERRHLREACGLSQQDLALEVGCDCSTISRYESGTRKPAAVNVAPYAAVLRRLAAEQELLVVNDDDPVSAGSRVTPTTTDGVGRDEHEQR